MDSKCTEKLGRAITQACAADPYDFTLVLPQTFATAREAELFVPARIAKEFYYGRRYQNPDLNVILCLARLPLESLTVALIHGGNDNEDTREDNADYFEFHSCNIFQCLDARHLVRKIAWEEPMATSMQLPEIYWPDNTK